jgi:hypothetical protein
MSHNVPAVYDVFARPNKGFAKQRPGRRKCGGEKPHKGAKRRLGFFVAQNAARHFAYTDVQRRKIFLRSARHGRRAVSSFYLYLFPFIYFF